MFYWDLPVLKGFTPKSFSLYYRLGKGYHRNKIKTMAMPIITKIYSWCCSCSYSSSVKAYYSALLNYNFNYSNKAEMKPFFIYSKCNCIMESFKLGIQDLDVVLRTSRMRWFGHVERSTGWIFRSMQAECGCTEKIWHAKEIMG